jgi:hypothetical protein
MYATADECLSKEEVRSGTRIRPPVSCQLVEGVESSIDVRSCKLLATNCIVVALSTLKDYKYEMAETLRLERTLYMFFYNRLKLEVYSYFIKDSSNTTP